MNIVSCYCFVYYMKFKTCIQSLSKYITSVFFTLPLLFQPYRRSKHYRLKPGQSISTLKGTRPTSTVTMLAVSRPRPRSPSELMCSLPPLPSRGLLHLHSLQHLPHHCSRFYKIRSKRKLFALVQGESEAV